METTFERRRAKRLRLSASALVSLVSEDPKYWPIVDIGRWGLAFRHMSNGRPLDEYSTELIIATKDLLIFEEGIPFRVVSVSELSEEFPSSNAGGFVWKRYGVEFGELNGRQISQLERLMQEYAVGAL